MTRKEFIQELDSRLKTAGWADDVELDSTNIEEVHLKDDDGAETEETANEVISTEFEGLVSDVISGDWDEESEAEKG